MELSGSFLACAQAVRAADYDRYLSVLFAPREKRDALFALYAFNFEVSKTAEAVSAPTLGLIRLQWWREAIEGIYEGRPRKHEVIAALGATIAAHELPRALFDALIDAREQDLAQTPFATMDELEFYADATSGHLMRLAARILDAGVTLDGAAREYGISYALTGLLRAFPFHAAKGRLMLPLDRVVASGTTPEEIFAGHTHNIRILTDGIAAAALAHFSAASPPRVPRAHLAALLPAALIRPYLKHMQREGFDPYRDPAELSIPRRQIAMLGAILRGRI